MVEVKVTGAIDINRRLKKLSVSVPNELKKALQLSGVLVEGVAKRKSPVDTGRLRGSINSRVESGEAIIGTNVNYAPFVELGTWKMRAQPFLRPALKESKNKIMKIFEGLVKKKIKAEVRL